MSVFPASVLPRDSHIATKPVPLTSGLPFCFRARCGKFWRDAAFSPDWLKDCNGLRERLDVVMLPTKSLATPIAGN